MLMFAPYFLFLLVPTQLVIALEFNTTVSKKQHSISKQGWTPQPDGRGTLDIIWSCAITVSLCSWSILCMNIPGSKESQRQILWRKLSLTVLGILCPEMVFEFALGQWLAARQSVRDFKSPSYEHRPKKSRWCKTNHIGNWFSEGKSTQNGSAVPRWTMKDAFFADMGGFLLHTRDQLPFPLDARQLHYLVSKGYLEMPVLDHRVIEGKNKVDGILRVITLCQITWFVVNTICRWSQHLTVTTAELTTVSFILCSLGTAFCWWHKPADAIVAEVIESDISINDILHAEGQPLDAWKRTPLDFINRQEFWYSKIWSNIVNILRVTHLTFGSHTTPIDRIPDSIQKEVPLKHFYICIILAIGYISVLFVGWDYSFPTRTEQLLWRAACVATMATLIPFVVFPHLVRIYPAFRRVLRGSSPKRDFQPTGLEGGGQQGFSKGKHKSRRFDIALDGVRNNSLEKDPLLYIPLKFIFPIYVVAVIYGSARGYILIEDAIELRSLPSSAYATVNWQRYIPHIG